ncbi:hypothetical protein PSPO_b1787 [Pseudoalteromonas spongiae UST010723-006]|nr:hypothetical protein PSPO_b1787 [Pseudoalteromonas spongiae UST010723-006]
MKFKTQFLFFELFGGVTEKSPNNRYRPPAHLCTKASMETNT